MIVTSDVFNAISKGIKAFTNAKYNTDCYVAGTRQNTPPKFPCVWCVEIDDYSNSKAETLDFTDEQRNSVFEIQSYSNLKSGATLQAKAIIDEASKLMKKMGYRCTTLTPVDNAADENIKRYVARYKRFLGGGDTIEV